MKISKTLGFILSVLFLLFGLWRFFPAGGVEVGGLVLRYPSYASERIPEAPSVDVDSVLKALSESAVVTYSDSLRDSVAFYRNYLTTNEARIHFPNGDLTYFDSLFACFEQARYSEQPVRVMHYGDSQIELDRMSSVLRQRLQELFGGTGPGMIPPVQTVPSISVSQQDWNLTPYTVYGDSTTRRAAHRRYGVMTRFSTVRGNASVSFMRTNSSLAMENVKQFTEVSVLLRPDTTGTVVSLSVDDKTELADTLRYDGKVQRVTWKLPSAVRRGTVRFSGRADVYALLLDGGPGVAVDNVPLRGCSGTIFTGIERESMAQSFALLGTRLILLQFGGNRMPSVSKPESISTYMKEISRQIAYFRRVAPEAVLLFVGPSDMSRSYDGRMDTWKGLPALNDSLRMTVLRNGVAYWDMFRVMGGEGSMVQYVQHNPPLAGTDYIHFTHAGAQQIGGALATSLQMCYECWRLRCRWQDSPLFDWVRPAQETPADSLHSEYLIFMPR